MMDYYSQFPAPPYEECKRQAITVARLKYKSWAWNQNDEELNALVTEAFMESGVLEFNNDPNPKIKFSYSGWCVFGKNDVITSCDKIIIRKKKEKMRRMIRGLLRTSYLLIKAHNQTMEKLYHPDSVFVNTVLKSDFESVANLPPIPPSKTD